MSREMLPYPAYKDSGVEWIGKVPEDWELVKLKHLTSEKLLYGANESARSNNKDLPRFIRITDIDKAGNLREETYKSLPMSKAKNFLLQYGDILFARSGATVGKTYYHNSEKPDCFAGYLIRFRHDNQKVSSKYIYYYTQTQAYKDWIRLNLIQATIENVSAERYSSLLIPLTNRERQDEIVKFLDQKTSEIDALISDKEKLISLLEEKRQAVITETVTKALDPNVKMKDSGIDWIGEIPEHWVVTKVKYYSKMLTGATPSRNNMNYWENGTVNWMTSGEINKEFIYSVENKITDLGMKNSSTLLLPINTVMIALNGQGKTKGKAAILKVSATCNQSLVGFIADEEKLHYLYLYYFLKTKYKDLRGLVGDGLRDGISLGLLKTLSINLPLYEEQIKIAKYIKEYDDKINDLIDKINISKNYYQEYRESLIYEAVTGKIDLRDYGEETESLVAERSETYGH